MEDYRKANKGYKYMLEIDLLGELFEVFLRRNVINDPRFKNELVKKYIGEMGREISF